MAQVEFWTGLSATVEAKKEQYIKSQLTVEAKKEQYIKSQLTVEDVRNTYISAQVQVEDAREKWAKLSRAVHLRAYKYASVSEQVESFASSWNALLANIVNKHIDKYTSSQVNVEAMKGQYTQIQPNVEWYQNKWVGQSTFAQNFKDQWVKNSVDVESYISEYIINQVNVEEYRNKYFRLAHTVEEFKLFYASQVKQVEGFQKKWCGLYMFVRPAIYFDPVGGTYDTWVTVDINMELLPVDARITLNGIEPNVGSAQYLGQDILVRRPKSVWVKAYYADGYVVDRREDYIVPVGGYIIASDDKEVVSIDEDVLWQM